jgi:2'-5' RNA ligase
MKMKTHESAVVVIPPDDVWEPIQDIRRVHDRQIERWMPHITLLYPFLPYNEFSTAEKKLVRVCLSIKPFNLILSTFRSFSHGHGKFTVWLDPEPHEPLLSLQTSLQSEFPECDDVSRYKGGFTPHLSVGQFTGSSQVPEEIAPLQSTWNPLRFKVTALAVIYRTGDVPFRIHDCTPLGTRGGK